VLWFVLGVVWVDYLPEPLSLSLSVRLSYTCRNLILGAFSYRLLSEGWQRVNL
jgi:hypothetical protein